VRLVIALCLLLASLPCVCLAAKQAIPLGVGNLPDSLGVNIHFTDPRPGEMEMLSEAGFKWVRMDFGWEGTEPRKGKYNFAAYDRLMAALDQHHIRPIFILDYSNRFYDDGLSPHSDEGRKAFAKWAAAAATHFKGRGVVWEMYNEPNIQFWKPKPNADDYVKLALAAGRALREAMPREPYIGPASSTVDFKFLEACFKGGCLEYWSAVSVHPYRQKNPETVAADYQKLRDLIAKYAPAGKNIPIVSGEWGYSSGWKKFDETLQGKYLPRELLTNVANGIPISIWYDWHDDGTNPKEPEHHFGTVHPEYRQGQEPVYEPKPAYFAMKTLSASLAGCKFIKRVDSGSDADWVLVFQSETGQRLAAWTTGDAHEIAIPDVHGTFSSRAWTGDTLPEVKSDGSGLRLRLTDAPQYLNGPVNSR